jgi:hypothetical protein
MSGNQDNPIRLQVAAKEHLACEHLTERQIDQWLVEGQHDGGLQGSVRQHLQECHACQERISAAEEPLAAFRAAVVSWSVVQGASLRPLPANLDTRAAKRWGIQIWLPTGSLALATLLLVMFLDGFSPFRGRSVAPASAVETFVASDNDSSQDSARDTVLLSQVDAEVSEAVPDSMAPLTDLVAWDSEARSATAGKKSARKKTVGSNARVKLGAAD